MVVNIFGYGSLLYERSRRETFTEVSIVCPVYLRGYRRVLNACHPSFSHIAMNIRPEHDSSVYGLVVSIHEGDMPALRKREEGYDMIEVTDRLSQAFSGPVYTFMMLQPEYLPHSKFRQEYINLCLLGLPVDVRAEYLLETEFPFCAISVEEVLKNVK